jgi:hypothetical protein
MASNLAALKYEIKNRMLEKMQLRSIMQIVGAMLHDPKLDVEYDFESERLFAMLSAVVWREKIVEKTHFLAVQRYKTWWDHFKDTFFDCNNHWFWKKHPPKTETVKNKISFHQYAVYPAFKYLDGDKYEVIFHETIEKED